MGMNADKHMVAVSVGTSTGVTGVNLMWHPVYGNL